MSPLIGKDPIDLAAEDTMSSIQGVQSSAPVAPPKAQAVQPAKPANGEAKETAQVERAEASRGAQEAGERQAAPSGNAAVGTRFNASA